MTWQWGNGLRRSNGLGLAGRCPAVRLRGTLSSGVVGGCGGLAGGGRRHRRGRRSRGGHVDGLQSTNHRLWGDGQRFGFRRGFRFRGGDRPDRRWFRFGGGSGSGFRFGGEGGLGLRRRRRLGRCRFGRGCRFGGRSGFRFGFEGEGGLGLRRGLHGRRLGRCRFGRGVDDAEDLRAADDDRDRRRGRAASRRVGRGRFRITTGGDLGDRRVVGVGGRPGRAPAEADGVTDPADEARLLRRRGRLRCDGQLQDGRRLLDLRPGPFEEAPTRAAEAVGWIVLEPALHADDHVVLPRGPGIATTPARRGHTRLRMVPRAMNRPAGSPSRWRLTP